MSAPDHDDDDSQPRGEPPVRLAALCRGDARNASLHVAVGDGFVAVAPGDKVSIGIAGIGELVNTVAEPR
jgi:hypothetical protein